MAGTTRKEWGNYYERGRGWGIITNRGGVRNLLLTREGWGIITNRGGSGRIITNREGSGESIANKGGGGELLRTGERVGDDEQGSEWGNCYEQNKV